MLPKTSCYFVLVLQIFVTNSLSSSRHDGSPNVTSSTISGCENAKELLECMDEFLPQAIIGIPSNREETLITCGVFNSSMNCVLRDMNKCNGDPLIDAILLASILPTIEMYKKICNNEKSMEEFYRFGECYKKVSPGYLLCSDWYGQVRGGLSYSKDSFKICCHQINFLKCVSKVAKHHCNFSPDAYNAVMNLAKEAVQISRSEGTGKQHCKLENSKQCSEFTGQGNQAIPGNFGFLLMMLLCINLLKGIMPE